MENASVHKKAHLARKQRKARAQRKWGREAFFEAGEATFGGDEA